jgi:hypothetical protein
VFGSRLEVTRRDFLKAAAASALWRPSLHAQDGAAARVTLPNGIVLPHPWPPRRGEWIGVAEQPPYLASPPAVITIDSGRQLFVDDFLVESSALYREFHAATYYDGNPVLTPERAWEREDAHARLAGYPPSPSAMVFSDGVFFDARDRLFKMWYMAGYQGQTALAVSSDGLQWERPAFGVVPGTNIVCVDRRDSSTVWINQAADVAGARYTMASYDLGLKALRLYESADGVRWRQTGVSGPCGDRSTFFRNPVRGVWAFSLRHDTAGINRSRRYVEARAFGEARWRDTEPVSWIGADREDHPHPSVPATIPELYSLDVAAYESLFVGLFGIYRGEPPDREKTNDLCVGFSRDGFHWSRLSRAPFIGLSNTRGDWNFANVQSAGGACLVVGERLHFYVSGRAGVPGTSLPGVCATGLATLRRDGFASVTDVWPAGVARAVTGTPGTLVTRPLTFRGEHLFVNAQAAGQLRAEVLDRDGRIIEGFSLERSSVVTGDHTRARISWQGGASLARLAGAPVRIRFALARALLFAFWVSPSPRGESRGYVAAGGPGFTTDIDA